MMQSMAIDATTCHEGCRLRTSSYTGGNDIGRGREGLDSRNRGIHGVENRARRFDAGNRSEHALRQAQVVWDRKAARFEIAKAEVFSTFNKKPGGRCWPRA